MNRDPDPELSLPTPDLLRLIGEMDSGQLAPADRDALSDILQSSPEARTLYFDYFKLSAMLHAEAEMQSIDGTLPVLGGRLQQRRSLRTSLLAAAAAVAVLAILGLLFIPEVTEPDTLSLQAAAGSSWKVGRAKDRNEDPTADLRKGDTLLVASGTLSLKSKHGPQLLVQGPATIRFPDLDRPVLDRGWLWVESAGNEAPTTIKAPGLTIRDIGTRFGVRVRDDKSCEIHLISGIVDVQSDGGGPPTRISTAAKAHLVTGQGGIKDIPIAVDPFDSLGGLLRSRPGYATTIMSQSPSGYWRLDETSGRTGANLVSGGSTAGIDRDVDLRAPGVRPSDGLPGFEDDNSGAALPGQSERSVIHSIDSPGGVSEEEGAVVFWFRRPPGVTTPEILWWAGTNASAERRHEIRLALTESGHVEFFIANDRSDIRLDSGRSFTDDRWHHLAASWSPRDVTLSIDGQALDRDGGPRATEGPVIRNKLVRFGKLGPFGGEYLRHYQGRLDEIALWNRSLSAAEIMIQHNAARDMLTPTGNTDTR